MYHQWYTHHSLRTTALINELELNQTKNHVTVFVLKVIKLVRRHLQYTDVHNSSSGPGPGPAMTDRLTISLSGSRHGTAEQTQTEPQTSSLRTHSHSRRGFYNCSRTSVSSRSGAGRRRCCCRRGIVWAAGRPSDAATSLLHPSLSHTHTYTPESEVWPRPGLTFIPPEYRAALRSQLQQRPYGSVKRSTWRLKAPSTFTFNDVIKAEDDAVKDVMDLRT